MISAITALLVLIKTYRIMLAPSPATFTNFTLFMLWFVMLFAVLVATMFLSGLASLFLFPPVVERVYANDKFTVLRLGD